MAVNLNPGADATLVQAATNAAMANVPKDLSQMFQAQTENYRKTMESVGESYGNIIKTITSVAKPFVQEQIHNQKMKNLGRDLHSRGLGVEFEDRLNKLRDDKKAIFGMKGSERRNARKDIKVEQEKLFADIQITEDGMHGLSEQIASENYSKEGTSLFNQVQAQGIANGNNPIKEGPYKGFKSVPITNKDGDRGWQLQNSAGKVVSNIDQFGIVTLASKGTSAVVGVDAVEASDGVEAVEGVTAVDAVNAVEGSFVSNSKIGSLLQGKVALEVETSLNALTNDALKGKVSLTGTKPSIERQIDGMVNEGNIAALQHKTLGNNPRTFIDDLHSESKLSVEMFNALQGIEGLQDSNDNGVIDKGDFASPENMSILNEAMRPGSNSYDYDTAKNAFKSWYADSVINSSNLAENLKKKEDGLFPTIEKGKTLDLLGIKIPKESLESYYNDIEAGNEFKIGDFTFKPKFGGWEKDDGVNGVVGTYDNTADMLKNGLGPGGRHEGFKGIKQFEENTEGVFINKELSGKINDLFGTDKTEESAVSNLNILFKDEPLLEGMFTDPMGMGQIIEFNGGKYDVENGADAITLEKDINEYLKENKKEETGAGEDKDGNIAPPSDQLTKIDPVGAELLETGITDASNSAGMTGSAVAPESAQTGDQLTKIDSVGMGLLPTGITDPNNGVGMTGPAVVPGSENSSDSVEVSSAASNFNETPNENSEFRKENSVASTHKISKNGKLTGKTHTFPFSKNFVNAVAEDEKNIQRYIKQNPNVYPGVEIITDGVKGNDAFIVRVNGKEKKFQADPKFPDVKYGTVGSNDQRRALEIHDWIKENSGGKTTASEIKAPVNNTEPEVVEKVVEKNPVLKAAASESTSNTNPVDWLKNSGFIGANESQSDTTLVKTVNLVFDELLGETSRESNLDLTHDDKAWCGALVYEVLTSTNAIPEFGGKKSSDPAYNLLRAREYLKVGTDTKEPKIGDIMVTSRSAGILGTSTRYHVGFYGGKDKDGNILQLGGNQSNKLSYRTIPKGQKIEGYRRLDNMADVKEATVVEQKAKTKANEAPNLG